MKIYVASKSSNRRWALDPEHIIEVTYEGPNPQGDAMSYAKGYVKAEEQNAYVYEVDAKLVRGYRIHKEVVTIVTTES